MGERYLVALCALILCLAVLSSGLPSCKDVQPIYVGGMLVAGCTTKR